MIDPCLFGPFTENEKTAVWEVTKHCNLHCPHCCSNSGNVGIENDYTDIDTEEALKIVDIFHNNNINVLYISGGEPLLWKPLVKVIEQANKYGMKCCIASSGFEFDEKLMHEILQLDITSFHISIDSYCAEKHDKFRGVKGSFDKALHFIDYLKSKNINVVTSTMLTDDLIAHADELFALLKNHRVDRAVLNFFVPLGRASNMNCNIISTKQKSAIAQKLIKKAKEIDFVISIKRIVENKQCLDICPGGRYLVHMNAYGEISPCSWIGKLWPEFVTGIRQDIFDENTIALLDEKIKNLTDIKCEGCSLNDSCKRGCPVIAYFEGAHYDTLCQQ